MSIIFSYDGIALTHQKVVPGDVITALSAYCYKYQVYRLNFDAGTDEIVAGDWITDAGSPYAKGKVLSVTVTSGDFGAGNDAAGYILFDSWDGGAWTNNQKIKVAADATMADINQVAAIVEATDAEYASVYRLQYKHLKAKSALVVVYANTALVGITGGKPDQTARIGTPMIANSSIRLKDHNAISNFYCVDYTSLSASIVQVDFYF